DLLRHQIGFDGVLVSDYFTIQTLASYHRIAADEEDAARRALEAGLDIELPALHCYGAPLRQAVENQRVGMPLIDAAVSRILRMKFQLGLFENPYVDAAAAPALFDTAEQRALARRIAQRSIVLLKNDGLLPLDRTLPSIAVVGPGAASVRMLQGDYHYPAHLEVMFGAITEGDMSPRPSGQVNLAQHFVPMVSVLDGITSRVAPQTAVYTAPGCEVLGDSTAGF